MLVGVRHYQAEQTYRGLSINPVNVTSGETQTAARYPLGKEIMNIIATGGSGFRIIFHSGEYRTVGFSALAKSI